MVAVVWVFLPHSLSEECDHPEPPALCRPINSAVMYFMNVQMVCGEGQGKALPWDKKLALAKSGFYYIYFHFPNTSTICQQLRLCINIHPFISPIRFLNFFIPFFFFFHFVQSGPFSYCPRWGWDPQTRTFQL